MLLKEDWKQNLVLIGFCFLLREVLTASTLAFVAIGLVLVLIGKRPNKYVRNILAVLVFASYWIKYGKIIDPEIGVNFLTSIITLKILEKETVRDRYMIFFGLLLLISAGSLFERTLTYVFFYGVSFLLLLNTFYSYLNLKWKIKDIVVALVWVFPLTFILFFLVPRMLNPIPFQQNSLSPGEIGYTPEVLISEIESLEPNNSPVFQVVTSRRLNEGELYWRANTLSFNDGWNWREHFQDKPPAEEMLGVSESPGDIKQSFRMYARPEYFFALNYPSFVTYERNYLKLNASMKTLPQRRWDWVQRYEVYSNPQTVLTDKGHEKYYLQVPLSKKEKARIAGMFPGSTFEEVTGSIRSHFRKERFSYSLSPGKSATINEFMEKKIGFCSHYSSAVALILRLKGIPSRLVSGFMGGNYNRYADFYLVSQNDAHVWVEAWDNGHWNRIDPTEWIAPDRIRLGGEAFVESVSGNVFGRQKFFRLPPVFNDLRMWFGQWDFHFYQWLEEMDYHSQDALLAKFKFKRQWLYSVIPLVMVAFMLLYTWYMATRSTRKESSPHQDLWNMFREKMKKRGFEISSVSVMESKSAIEKDGEAMSVFHDLVEMSFADKKMSLKDMKKRIRAL